MRSCTDKNKIIDKKHLEPLFLLKVFSPLLIVLSLFVSLQAQENDVRHNLKEIGGLVNSVSDEYLEKDISLAIKSDDKQPETFSKIKVEEIDSRFSFIYVKDQSNKIKDLRSAKRAFLKDGARETDEELFETDQNYNANSYDSDQEKYKERFHWKPAVVQSLTFLSIQHGFRLLQKKTQNELGGPFFRDWANSVKNLRGWRDGDSEFINYIAHPLQGGVTGRIFINNSDNARKQEFSKSRDYWMSRARTMAWSAVWSTQFEMGPLSEATIGNVGLREKNGHSSMAFVDLVVTPVIGTGVVVGEDAIDKYILKNWFERKKGGRVSTQIKILRTFLTPTMGFSNLLRGRYPWKRDTRN